MQVKPDHTVESDTPLQLLLFVDKRPSSREQVRQVRSVLKELKEQCDFEIQIIDVTEQPYLAEYFRLIATPALLKIHPEPRHTLAGMNLVAQLRQWWPQWHRSVKEYLARTPDTPPPTGATFRQELLKTAEKSEPAISVVPETPPPVQEPENSTLARPSQMPLSDVHNAVKLVSHSTEMIRLSDELFRLQREKEELEHQLRFKDQIISMLAHDLRNPLTAASIALETLEMGYNSENVNPRLTPHLMHQLVQHARTQTRAIDRMITDILQAARGSSSELRIQPQKMDLGKLCQDVLVHLSDGYQKRSQRLEQDIPPDLPCVLADSDRIRQVLINLLENAIKYTPSGGSIQLSALHRTAQKVQISVCDNGPGIPPENQKHIFEERYRLKRDESKEGYGIGLSLCQRIIRAHYGQIWVDSTPNQGSCFHFTLPVFRG